MIDDRVRTTTAEAEVRVILPRSCLVTLSILAITAIAGERAAAQSPAKGNREESLAWLTNQASSYRIRLADNRTADFTKQPLIRFTKVLSEVDDAAMFVWLSNGRPVVAETMLVQRTLGLYHEFQSLATEPLTAERSGKTVWKPQQAGVTFARIPDSDRPAESPVRRLTQMKTLAERFRAQAIKGPPFYAEGSVYHLRLLPQPMLRYRDPQHPELEGALFAFCQDTDPEAMLLVENRVRDGQPGWEFAFAAMTGWSVQAFDQDEPVWSIERQHPAKDPELTYFVAGPYPLPEK